MAILKSLDDQIQIQIEEGQNLLLGRLEKCDIFLEDGSISSQHARLKMENHHLRVVDMESTNGTRLNYSFLSAPAYLQDGDTIEFGNVTFVVDGPELTSPKEQDLSVQPLLTSLEPIDASQKMEDTMINMDLSQEELAEAEIQEPQAPVPQPVKHEFDNHQPVRLAFFLAFILILISGILLINYLWNSPPRI